MRLETSLAWGLPLQLAVKWVLHCRWHFHPYRLCMCQVVQDFDLMTLNPLCS